MIEQLPSELLARAFRLNEVEVAWQFPDVPEAAKAIAALQLFIPGGDALIVYPPEIRGGGRGVFNQWRIREPPCDPDIWADACMQAAEDTIHTVADLHEQRAQWAPTDGLEHIWYDLFWSVLNPNYRLGWA
jgi:hypothetical protein